MRRRSASPVPPAPARSARRGWLPLTIGVLAMAWGLRAAAGQAWLCDDAFISFRYAEHLAHGLGLVYNAGERVEGFSNLLWTLLTALGMRLGVAPENGSIAWGLVCFAATLAALLADALARPAAGAAARPWVPLACVLVAVHPDAQRFATGGLETSMFTFLVTAGVLLVLRGAGGVRAIAGSALAFALAALTRPDGLLFAPLVAAWLLVSPAKVRAALPVFAGVFLAVWAPVTIARTLYYGDFLPNTWYAKSAGLAWYSQGWIYVRLFLARSWPLALALPVVVAAGGAARFGKRPFPSEALLPLLLAIVYTGFVLRVGGDFMYARLLVPVIPLLALSLARGLAALSPRHANVSLALGLLAAAAVALAPNPLPDGALVSGIVDEAGIYTPARMEATRAEGLALRRFFAGLPVTVAIVGSQAALAYYADPAVVIEAGAGLTDRHIAHQVLLARGRVGHEKHADVAYLLSRKVDFTFHHFASSTLDLNATLPMCVIAFGSTPARIVHWNPKLLTELARRGARFEDFPRIVDAAAARLDAQPDADARNAYARIKAFYFDFVSDPAHELPFRARLARAAPPGRASLGAP